MDYTLAGNRLMELINLLYEGNITQFALDYGLREVNTTNYIKARRGVPLKLVDEISATDGINVEWLLGKENVFMFDDTAIGVKNRAKYFDPENIVDVREATIQLYYVLTKFINVEIFAKEYNLDLFKVKYYFRGFLPLSPDIELALSYAGYYSSSEINELGEEINKKANRQKKKETPQELDLPTKILIKEYLEELLDKKNI